MYCSGKGRSKPQNLRICSICSSLKKSGATTMMGSPLKRRMKNTTRETMNIVTTNCANREMKKPRTFTCPKPVYAVGATR